MICKLFHILISLPLTIYVNFICFDFKPACRLPIIVDFRTRIKGLYKGCIVLKCKPKFAIVKYAWGYGSYGNICNRKSFLIFKGGKIIFEGNAQFAMGTTLRADNQGVISFGRNFIANQNFSAFSNTLIQFGDNCITGWNVNLRDSDGHYITNYNGDILNNNKPIHIGDNVWLSSHCDILKGSKVSNNSIVGFRTLVAGKFEEPNIIIAGVPGKVIKKDINWKR